MPYPKEASFVIPGQRLLDYTEKSMAGKGTYVREDRIYSSIAGYVRHRSQVDESIIVEVRKPDEKVIMPDVGAIVTAKVINVHRRYLKCVIFCMEDSFLKEPFRGMVRREDVSEKNKHKVEMHKFFRTGDIILARVKATGVAQGYILSTAENELGVVAAQSESRAMMVPVGSMEMMCPKTFTKEPRKVAKVVPKSFALTREKSEYSCIDNYS